MKEKKKKIPTEQAEERKPGGSITQQFDTDLQALVKKYQQLDKDLGIGEFNDVMLNIVVNGKNNHSVLALTFKDDHGDRLKRTTIDFLKGTKRLINEVMKITDVEDDIDSFNIGF